ncbi:shikimate kinase [Alkalibacillus almallahensis]|uniref:shikimate kinase n=1 Tax=Alkalibacillus almallahensis TaxID=1379154 RepID=UPI0014216B82|nr:shikimate kinase [Alkalibacillus almallahensis]NIK12436.1 shikimate kinase [Alkalibacillus almallahensis]
MTSIALIGFMGSGKSTIGYQLASQNHRKFIDLDDEITKFEGREIATIFAQDGEEYFRHVEEKILNQFSEANVIVATGGGIVMNQNSREILKNCFHTIWLEVSYNVVENRLRLDDTRPLWKQSKEQRQALFERRQGLYEECADMRVSVNERSPNQIATEIEGSISFI